MRRRLVQVVVVLIGLFAAAQLVRPQRASPQTDPGRTIQAHMGTTSGVVAVLDRSCGDCHSNRSVSGWYANVAPLSWLLAYSVAQGRKVVNFSEWAGYSPERQRELLSLSCKAASEGKMPGAYTLFRPDTKLSPQDLETLCAAARQAASEGVKP
jgi:hypothetical protein